MPPPPFAAADAFSMPAELPATPEMPHATFSRFYADFHLYFRHSKLITNAAIATEELMPLRLPLRHFEPLRLRFADFT